MKIAKHLIAKDNSNYDVIGDYISSKTALSE